MYHRIMSPNRVPYGMNYCCSGIPVYESRLQLHTMDVTPQNFDLASAAAVAATLLLLYVDDHSHRSNLPAKSPTVLCGHQLERRAGSVSPQPSPPPLCPTTRPHRSPLVLVPLPSVPVKNGIKYAVDDR